MSTSRLVVRCRQQISTLWFVSRLHISDSWFVGRQWYIDSRSSVDSMISFDHLCVDHGLTIVDVQSILYHALFVCWSTTVAQMSMFGRPRSSICSFGIRLRFTYYRCPVDTSTLIGRSLVNIWGGIVVVQSTLSPKLSKHGRQQVKTST